VHYEPISLITTTTFTVPYLREYLQEHAATMGLDPLKLDRPAQGLV
jgi:hypothetical protein